MINSSVVYYLFNFLSRNKTWLASIVRSHEIVKIDFEASDSLISRVNENIDENEDFEKNVFSTNVGEDLEDVFSIDTTNEDVFSTNVNKDFEEDISSIDEIFEKNTKTLLLKRHVNSII